MGLPPAFRRLPLLLLPLLLAGCIAAGGPSGGWVQRSQVRQLFEDRTILPEHTYYYYGGSTMPDAIIAIHNSYTLQTRIWTRVDITQEMLDSWMSWYRSDINIACSYRGGDIITPEGTSAGIWYSTRELSPVKTIAPGVIEVWMPRFRPGSLCERVWRYDDL